MKDLINEYVDDLTIQIDRMLFEMLEKYIAIDDNKKNDINYLKDILNKNNLRITRDDNPELHRNIITFTLIFAVRRSFKGETKSL